MKYKKNIIWSYFYSTLLFGLSAHIYSVSASLSGQEGFTQSLYSIPLIDRCGIVAVIEGKRECQPPESVSRPAIIRGDQSEYQCQSVVEILTPEWSKTAVRYCSPGADFSLFKTIGRQNNPLRITSQLKTIDAESTHVIEMAGEDLTKTYEMPASQFPALPDHASNPDIQDIIIALRPQMLEHYDDETSLITSWRHRISVSNALTNEVIERVEEQNDRGPHNRFITMETGDHYIMAVKLDEENQPEAVFLDDMQGAWMRSFLKHSAPVKFIGNSAEFLTHGWKIAEYGINLWKSKAVFAMNTGKFLHNAIEMTEHSYHLKTDIHDAWHSYKGIPKSNLTALQTNLTIPSSTWSDYLPGMPITPSWMFTIGFGLLEAGNFGMSVYELYSERQHGKMKLIRNVIGPTIAIINIMSHLTNYEPHRERIEEMKDMRYKEKFQSHHNTHP